MGPCQPYCRSSAAAEPPAWPAPTITTRPVASLMRRSVHLLLDRLDSGIAEAEVMGDFMHQDVAHQPIEILAGFDPLHQDRLPVQEDQVRLRRHVTQAALGERYAAIQAR